MNLFPDILEHVKIFQLACDAKGKRSRVSFFCATFWSHILCAEEYNKAQ